MGGEELSFLAGSLNNLFSYVRIFLLERYSVFCSGGNQYYSMHMFSFCLFVYLLRADYR